MATEEEKCRLHARWAALKAACRTSHKGGPGGAAMCVCGASGGGSDACNMLRELKELIRYMPTEGFPEVVAGRVDDIRAYALW